MPNEFNFDDEDERDYRPRRRRRRDVPDSTGLIIGGYLFALISVLIFPPGFGLAGAACGLICLARGSVLNGIIIVIFSLCCALLGMMLGIAVANGNLRLNI